MRTRYLLPAVGVNLVAACTLLGLVILSTDPDADVLKAVSLVGSNHAAVRQPQPTPSTVSSIYGVTRPISAIPHRAALPSLACSAGPPRPPAHPPTPTHTVNSTLFGNR